MLRNNKVNAVIAFLAAVVLWIYVVGQVNPETTARITGIPVVFAGEESLADNDLALVDPGNVTVDITIRGDRSDVRKVVAKSSRVTAVADISGLSKGEHTVSLDISVPSSVDLDKSSIEEVTVQIDDLIRKDIAVEIDYDGSFPESQKLGEVTIDPEKITVTGAAATVNKIDRMLAVVSASELSEKKTSFNKEVVAVDAYGQEVDHVSLSASKVHITAGLVATKMLPLTVETTGTPADGYEVSSVDAPATVTVEGPLSAISDLTEITAEAIDVTGLSGDATVDLSCKLPDGVSIIDPEKPQATVVIKAVESKSKTWTYDAADIVIDDLAEGYTAAVTGTVKVTVTDEKTVLDALKKADIVLHVSASGLEAGEQEAAVTQVSSLDDSKVAIDPATVTLTITAPEEENSKETTGE